MRCMHWTMPCMPVFHACMHACNPAVMPWVHFMCLCLSCMHHPMLHAINAFNEHECKYNPHMHALHESRMHTYHACLSTAQIEQGGMLHTITSNSADKIFILPCRETLAKDTTCNFWPSQCLGSGPILLHAKPGPAWTAWAFLALELELSMELTAYWHCQSMQERFPISCCMYNLGLVLNSFQPCACV